MSEIEEVEALERPIIVEVVASPVTVVEVSALPIAPGIGQEALATAVDAYLTENPPGMTLDDVRFTHNQVTPAAVWEIVHPLPFEPNVTITDSAGTRVETEITYPAPNLVRSISVGAFSGTARLS
ncbi:hypothetical protein [Glaciibacter superstes]|uniref:hypothetical protein n=1 Tax=Glaciibacter superstes TaxID=501023 RepID=UPI0003B71BD8|nr:hypothetical protein [Glaciibacter superstes]